MPIELGLFKALLNGNHLLYGPLAWCFHHLRAAFGYPGLAVESLRVLNSLLGAGGLAVFFLTLRRLGTDRAETAAWTAVLGAALGYWRWSVEAEAYILSTFLLTVNLFFLTRRVCGERLPPWLLGAVHGAAVVGHVVNLVLAPAALWAVLSGVRRGGRLRAGLAFAGGSAAVAGLSFVSALAVVHPGTWAEAAKWLMGSAGTMEGTFRWHGSWGLRPLGQWAAMTVNILTSFQPAFEARPAWGLSGILLWTARAFLLFFAAAFAASWGGLSGPRRAAAVVCLLWLAGYAAVFTSWEPHTMVYRVSDLVPIVLLLHLGAAQALGGRAAWAAPAALALLLAAGNLGAEIRPRSFRANNPHLSRMAYVRAHTRENDWVAAGGGRDELYLPYFARRRPLLIGRYHKALPDLARRIDDILASEEAVYATSTLLGDPFWGPFFRRHRPELLPRGPGGYALARLKRSSALRQVRSATSAGPIP